MAKTIELEVTGMTCDHCVRSVTNAIEDVPGVVGANVDLDAGRATVQVDNAEIDAIVAAVKEEGYEAAQK